MSKLPIVDRSGKAAGEYEIADALLVFDRGAQAVNDAVVGHLANRRQGSAHTKTKGEVAGSNRKLWKQKGTGRARTGLRQSPIWRGGGIAFGPRTRSYTVSMPRKKAQLAFRRALSEKIAAGQVTVLEELASKEGKTREIAALLSSLDHHGTTLILAATSDANLIRACRNLARADLVQASLVNTYQILRYTNVLVSREAMSLLETRLNPAKAAALGEEA